MITTNHIQRVAFEGDDLLIQIEGKEFRFGLKEVSSKLFNGSEFQRGFFKISPSGYGIHWPLLDEDLSIEALINRME